MPQRNLTRNGMIMSKSKNKKQTQPSVTWTDDVFRRELSRAEAKGFLVVPGSRVKELEVFNLAFESVSKVSIPDCGHVLIRFVED